MENFGRFAETTRTHTCTHSGVPGACPQVGIQLSIAKAHHSCPLELPANQRASTRHHFKENCGSEKDSETALPPGQKRVRVFLEVCSTSQPPDSDSSASAGHLHPAACSTYSKVERVGFSYSSTNNTYQKRIDDYINAFICLAPMTSQKMYGNEFMLREIS